MEGMLTNRRVRQAAIIVMLSVLGACSAKVDQAKFEPLYRVGKRASGSVSAGVNLLQYREILQTLTSEISIARDKAGNDAEKAMVAKYESALKGYADAGMIWGAKIEHGSTMRPSDSPELKRVTDDYPIEVSMAGGPSFDADAAIHVIWRAAAARIDAAEKIYLNAE